MTGYKKIYPGRATNIIAWSDMLLEMIGKSPFKVRNEVEKIKIYLNGEELKSVKWEM